MSCHQRGPLVREDSGVGCLFVNCKIAPVWFHSVCALQILTRDSVTTQVDGVVYYRIYSAISAVANVNDVHQATFLLAQTTLRNVLGTQTLSQILSGREEIAHSIQVKIQNTMMNSLILVISGWPPTSIVQNRDSLT